MERDVRICDSHARCVLQRHMRRVVREPGSHNGLPDDLLPRQRHLDVQYMDGVECNLRQRHSHACRFL